MEKCHTILVSIIFHERRSCQLGEEISLISCAVLSRFTHRSSNRYSSRNLAVDRLFDFFLKPDNIYKLGCARGGAYPARPNLLSKE